MPITKRQLAASIQSAVHIGDRGAIAAFVLDEATTFSPYNPFAATQVGSQRQIWTGQSLEFRVLSIACLGLPCLLKALAELPIDEPLVQEILQSGPHRAYIYHQGDGCRIVGAILHSKPHTALPIAPTRPRSRHRRVDTAALKQLDLFTIPLPLSGSAVGYEGRVTT